MGRNFYVLGSHGAGVDAWLTSDATKYGSTIAGRCRAFSVTVTLPSNGLVKKDPYTYYQTSKFALSAGSYSRTKSYMREVPAANAYTAPDIYRVLTELANGSDFWLRTSLSRIITLDLDGVSVASVTRGNYAAIPVDLYKWSGSPPKIELVPTVAQDNPNSSGIYADITFSGLTDSEVLTASVVDAQIEGTPFEVLSRNKIRVRIGDDYGGSYGDYTLSVGKRAAGTKLVVIPRSRDAAADAEVAGVGTYDIRATDSTGAAIYPEQETSAETGALSVQVPVGASCTVFYTIRPENERIWYREDGGSAAVAEIANAADIADGSPVSIPFYLAKRSLFFVEPSPNPPVGQIADFNVVSPATPDGIVDGRKVYAEGSRIVVAAVAGEEQTLTAAYLDSPDGTNIAGFDENDIEDGRFTIRSLNQSCLVRGVLTTKTYPVSVTADTASSGAFSLLSAEHDGVQIDSAEKGWMITVRATPTAGYSFEGFYIDGTRLQDVEMSDETAVLSVEVGGETRIVAKAKTRIRLSVSGDGRLLINNSVVETPYERDVALGDGLPFALEPTAANTYFLLWYKRGTDVPVYDYGRSGTIYPTSPLDIEARFGERDLTLPVKVEVGYVAGCSALNGFLRIDDEDVTVVDRIGSDTVTVSAKAYNGWIFDAWYANVGGVGTPVSKNPDFTFMAYLFDHLYASFVKNTHSICEWEGESSPKVLQWRSKTYAASKPFNPSACRVDALGYPPGVIPGSSLPRVLEFTVGMFSSPNGAQTAVAALPDKDGAGVITSQDARRLPVRRMERYMQIEVKSNSEVDALYVGTSMGELAQ